jgi:SAM-dependent methyltransferase
VPRDSFTTSNHPAWGYEAMLADAVRMERYRRAIQATLRPGDVVADLGTGLGVLAVMAAQAGAGRVYAVDRRPRSLRIAERIIGDNGVAACVRLVEGDVRDVDLGEPVDLIVNELIGEFGTDEDIAACVRLFADRNLRPGGAVLPRRLRTFLAPVEYGPEYRGVWRRDWHGLDLRAGNALRVEPEACMRTLIEKPRELGPLCRLEDILFGAGMPERDSKLPVSLEIAEVGELQGFAGWFEAELADGISLGNRPGDGGGHWQSWHWPVAPPLAVEPGQRIEGVLHAPSNQLAVGWKLDWAFV